MRILVTNDDGINAPGLDVCTAIAEAVGDEVTVVAPETDQSGLAHSLTMSDPLRLRQTAERRYAVGGTPSDCVIMAVRKIMDDPPDLVLSGVNRGRNIADDVTYSGTVAAAIEATLLGIPAIALSQGFNFASESPVPWDTARKLAPDVVRSLLDFGFPPGVLFNVNFPDRRAGEVAGRRVTVQGRRDHGLHLDERTDGRGRQYFWLTYRREKPDIEPGSDLEAVRDGYVSVTPLHLDLTAHKTADVLARHFEPDSDG